LGPDVREILAAEAGTAGLQPVPAHVYVKTLREDCEKMKVGFKEALSHVDALLLPTTPFPASRIGEEVGREWGGKGSLFLTYIRNCVPVSVVGYPAISVPAGYGRTGLPIGLQIIARPWEEANLLAMAYAFEQETKVRKPPVLWAKASAAPSL
jgi:aspartyl-tRNA(Asn)/glutamyl-tRNA(Gln) amidotransferase subunit A